MDENEEASTKKIQATEFLILLLDEFHTSKNTSSNHFIKLNLIVIDL